MPSRIAVFCLLLVFGREKSTAQVPADAIAQVTQYLREQARPISGNIARFTNLTQPYAPLDFQVRQANSKEASAVRNYLFGAASAFAGLDKEVAPKMANDFHCGQPCATTRIKNFVEQHERVTALVIRFVPLVGVDLIAQWNVTGDFRINDTFVRDGSIDSYKAVGPLGIVPNSEGTKAADLNAATGLSESQISEARKMIAELASLHLAAVVRSPEGIRVIRTGNADNQSGLLFKKVSVAAPKSGDSFGEGLDVDGADRIAKDIYYFETN